MYGEKNRPDGSRSNMTAAVCIDWILVHGKGLISERKTGYSRCLSVSPSQHNNHEANREEDD